MTRSPHAEQHPPVSHTVLVPYAEDPLARLATVLLDEHAERLPLLEGVTVLLPDLQAAPRLRRLLLEQAEARGHAALLGPQILGFDDWLVGHPLPGRTLIAPHAREVMLAEALKTHRYLYGHGNVWALADSLLELFDELTLNRRELPHKLEELLQHLAEGYGLGPRPFEAMQREAKLVHTLWHAWHEQLSARSLLDPQAARLLRLGSQTASDDGTQLYLAGHVRLSQAEREWLERLLGENRARLFLHGQVGEGLPPTHPDAPVSELWHAFNPAPPPSSEGSALGRLLDVTYNAGDEALAERARGFAARQPVSPAREHIEIFAADGAEEEARAVELQVRRWLLAGCERIGIITENRRLARRVRALLERAAIPLQDAAGWALSTTSAAAAMERWLQCVEEDFPYRPMLDLLKSTFIFPSRERAVHLETVYRLEQDVILHENIGRSLGRYRRQLRYRRERLPGELGRDYAAVEALLDELAEAAAILEPLSSGEPQAPQRLLQGLRRSLQRLGMEQALAADAAGGRLLQMLGQMEQGLFADAQPMSWPEFRAWLGRSLEQTNFRPPTEGSQVQLMGLGQSALGRFDALVIAGAEEEYLPGRGSPSPFFNDAVRQELGLPDSQQAQAERFYHFRRLLEAAPELLITLRRSQDGEEVPPSPWVARLQAFHRLAYADDALEAAALPELLHQPETQVLRSDTHELPPPATRPAAHPPATLLPRRYSASAYQQLMDCPYQFFASRCLGLAPAEAIREALEKSDYGARVHLCLQAFHGRVDDLPGPAPVPLTPANRAEAIDLLERIARTVFATDLEDNFLHRSWLKRWQALIPAYVDWQIERQAQWRVAQVEVEREQSPSPALTLHGRLDRVDRSAAGQGVVDYKTGTPPEEESVVMGESVQLPFYALLLGDGLHGGAEQVEYLQLDKAEVKAKAGLEGDTLAGLSAAVGARLEQLVEEMDGGAALPAWGDARTCEYCPMDGICRRESWEGGEV